MGQKGNEEKPVSKSKPHPVVHLSSICMSLASIWKLTRNSRATMVRWFKHDNSSIKNIGKGDKGKPPQNNMIH